MRLDGPTLRHYCDCDGECMRWKLGVNSAGIPVARLDGSVKSVPRWLFTHVYGKIAKQGQWITPKCGDRRCVSENCLQAVSPSTVQKRAYAAGKRNTHAEYLSRQRNRIAQGGVKLNVDIARQIRANPAGETDAAIARRLGVARSTVRSIRIGESWRDPAASVFTWMPQ